MERNEVEGLGHSDLTDAIADTGEVECDAKEESFPSPSKIAQANSLELLPKLYKIQPCRFEVYSTPDAEVAIDASWQMGSSMLLLCDLQGGALCLVNNQGKNRSAKYSDARHLPDKFIREAMNELAASR